MLKKTFNGFLQVATTIFVMASLMFAAGLEGPAWADSTSNVKVGIKQGAEELYVKTGGQIKVRDVSLFQIPMSLSDIGTASNKGVAKAPYPGTVSSIKCALDLQPLDGTTLLLSRIDGVVVTSGSVGVLSTTSAYQTITITPTAANTVATGSTISIESDGTTTVAPKAAC
jgi:dUTPase